MSLLRSKKIIKKHYVEAYEIADIGQFLNYKRSNSIRFSLIHGVELSYLTTLGWECRCSKSLFLSICIITLALSRNIYIIHIYISHIFHIYMKYELIWWESTRCHQMYSWESHSYPKIMLILNEESYNYFDLLYDCGELGMSIPIYCF